jgi:pyruvate dehydrogenase complex dehydrogenase (E1) component
MTPKTRPVKEEIDTLDSSTLKKFKKPKECIYSVKREARMPGRTRIEKRSLLEQIWNHVICHLRCENTSNLLI